MPKRYTNKASFIFYFYYVTNLELSLCRKSDSNWQSCRQEYIGCRFLTERCSSQDLATEWCYCAHARWTRVWLMVSAMRTGRQLDPAPYVMPDTLPTLSIVCQVHSHGHRTIDWYTGPWWVFFNVWHSENGLSVFTKCNGSPTKDLRITLYY